MSEPDAQTARAINARERANGHAIRVDFHEPAGPWSAGPVRSAHDAIRYLLEYIGENPDREDLQETPARILNAFVETFRGYKEQEALKWFESRATEMVVVRDIEFWSNCEHHWLPFWGLADVAYFPNGHVVGVSKVPRLVTNLAARLTIQENLTEQICAALTVDGKTFGAAVTIRAHHACMRSRGVRQTTAWMETNAVSGRFQADPSAQSTFMQGVRTHGC
jgi:GTP cyclohydrolase I